MKCYRCSSNMVYQKFYGPHEHYWGWRCIFCGEIIDQVIMENRLQGKTGPPTMARAKRR
jgi:hypothetical protein